MANMSYCKHENTAADLADVLGTWNEYTDASDSEMRARRRILEQAIELVRAAATEGLIDDMGRPVHDAEYHRLSALNEMEW